MKLKIGVMGSADEAGTTTIGETAISLGQAIGTRDLILLSGATTGVIHIVGKIARDTSAFHIGI